jgi:hypothetical protein
MTLQEFISKPENKQLFKLLHFWLKSEGGEYISAEFYVNFGGDVDSSWFHPYVHGTFEPKVPEKLTNFFERLYEVVVNNESIWDNIDWDNNHNIYVRYTVKNQSFSIEDRESITNTRDYGNEKEITDEEMIEEITKWKSEGIRTIKVDFDGGGDSGYINERGLGNGDIEVEMPASFSDFLYDMLESNYGGWEINEGSQGYFEIYTNDNLVQLSIGINEEDYEHHVLFEEQIEF